MNTGRRPTHGFARRGEKRPHEYNCWSSMVGRCTNINNLRYKTYGAIGIKVCDRWRKFELFFEDMGEAPTGKHTIDRYPNNKGNYEPGNVRWATPHEQNWNRSDNKMIVHKGETKPLAQWVYEMKLNYKLVYDRLKRGWTFEQSITAG